MPGETVSGAGDDVVDKIQALYNNYEFLNDEKNDKDRRTCAYLEIISAVHGSPQEKKLAAQFIPRFFKHFQDMGERPVEAMLDLCEDEDVNIRKQAVKALPTICRDAPENVFKIADVLAQLSQTDDTAELGVVFNSLVSIFSIDPKDTVRGIFGQVQQNEQEVIRERCLKFMTAKVRVWMEGGYLTKDVEDLILEEARKSSSDLNANEFLILMSILGQLKASKTVTGQQELVDLIADKMEIETPLTHLSAENFDRLHRCLREAMPYFSTPVNSNKYVHYLISHVFPYLDSMVSEVAHLKTDLFKLFAELTNHTSADFVTKFPQDLEAIYESVIALLVLPPTFDDSAVEGEQSAAAQKPDDGDEPNLGLSQIECFLFAFHRLLAQAPDFFKKSDSADGENKAAENELSERLIDLRKRLTYLSRRVQGYIKILRERLQGKSSEELKRDENKVRVVALRITANVQSLTKDFFHNPPSFKTVVPLSWKPAAARPGIQSRDRIFKRKPISFDEEGKHVGRPLYEPPGGKYSKTLDKYVPPPPGRGRGGGRGRFGRGRRGGGGYGRFGRV